jgi:tRNA nucleotidyltransferase (CCA-adding enzyme)
MSSVLQLRFDTDRLREVCHRLCERVRAAGGRAFAVGGCVRDAALGRICRDLDLEIFGIAPAKLDELLADEFPHERVGHAFSVWVLRGLAIDVSVPLCGRGPEAVFDAHATPERAAARRDFSLNAMALDPLSGELIDPFGGLRDLERRILRHASERFAEDPLRVLRAMQLAARFELDVAPETLALCRTLELEGIPRERVFAEWRKLVTLGERPSRGLAFLREAGALRTTPELAALIGCPQDPAWHPEGDVWIHTLHCMDAFAQERSADTHEDLVVGLAVLCHDFGKPEATRAERGRITAKGHERVGAQRARAFLERMTDARDLLVDVPLLVEAHRAPVALYEVRAGDTAVRRLARRVGRIDRLVRVARADQCGRPPHSLREFPAGDWLLARARALDIEAGAPRPLVQGRHLLALGLAPGPRIGELLEACYSAQIEGRFETLEAGIAFAREIVARGRSLAR